MGSRFGDAPLVVTRFAANAAATPTAGHADASARMVTEQKLPVISVASATVPAPPALHPKQRFELRGVLCLATAPEWSKPWFSRPDSA